ncbi:MAG: type IX secretion system protein PorQ [Paludibacter sp.]
MTKKFFISLSFIIASLTAFSQAGTGVYQFLDLPVSSRLAALGSYNVSLRDNDINFGFVNPALLTSETNNTLGLNMAFYLADIKFGSAIYGKNIDKKNFLAYGIQYVDYGLFKYANETNDQIGDTYFTAKDMALNIMYARVLNKYFTVGATLKPIYSAYETYTSYGVAMDAGISYNDSAHFFSAGLVFKNMGRQLKGYYSDEGGQHIEPLPINIQLGITKKLAYAPLRFSLTLQNLQQWDLTYQSTNQPSTITTTTKTTTTSSITTRNIQFLDMAFRHVIIAAEFVPSKNFYISASYNDRRAQELIMNGFKSSAGFSFGGGIKLYKFHVGFGTTQFQAGTASYQFSITTALNEFRL